MLSCDGQAARISDDQLRRTFSARTHRIRRWLTIQSNVELLTLNHREIIANPLASAATIASFLGGVCDVHRMAAVVDPTLYRLRS